jgi:SAM-dependent methyltransferase
MSEQDEQSRHDSWKALGIRTDIPHPARVYNYLLGGKDNFAADRDAAQMSLSVMPQIRDSARGNRQFLLRAVRYLRDAGIRQFLDIGTGLPASPSIHEVASAGGARSRVAYVDNDPVVFMRAEAVTVNDESALSVPADMRDVDEVLSAAGKLLDFSQPVGLLFVASLHNIPDADDPAGLVARYLAALAPGSYLVISHVTGDFAPEQMAMVTASYAQRGTVFVGRTREQVTAMFNGRDLIAPGVVQISYWRPEGGAPDVNADRVWGYAGVARL